MGKNMYLSWSEKIITDFSGENIGSLYNQGFLFTRKGKGKMYQTRSLRINLNKFELSSENKRILKKTENLKMNTVSLPHPSYDWRIHKMGKEFYEKKFGGKIFTANKLKELMTNEKKSNFNLLLEYKTVIPAKAGIHANGDPNPRLHGDDKTKPLGYCICFQTPEFLHYCYPFYDINVSIPDIGMGMMLKAILFAKDAKKQYIYLGSAQRHGDTYKLQFKGVEWWNEKKWDDDLQKVKALLKC